jgi:hypothetical protein
MDTVPSPRSSKKTRTLGKSITASAMLGCLIGGLCFVVLKAHHEVNPKIGAGDFQWSLDAARDLVAGRDIYRQEPGPLAIPYPLPAAFVAMPLAWLPDAVAGGAFIGISAAFLAFCFFRSHQEFRMAMFLSWPFVYALLWVQWTPLLCTLWFLPGAAMALILMKPNMALPILAARLGTPHEGANRLNAGSRVRAWFQDTLQTMPRAGILSVAVVGVLSIIVYPTWPIVWLQQTRTYEGIVPPLFVMPVGPFILLSLFAWRDRRTWLILFCALMPQRVVYDQLPLLLVARNRAELWILIACSWINGIIFWNTEGGWPAVPLGPQNFLILTLYLPAIAVLLWSLRKSTSPSSAIASSANAEARA